MEAPFVVCDNLVKVYKIADLEVVALQGLDMTIHAGEMVGVVGASGSGKTTLMNILGGLDRPTAGRVWVDELDLLKLSDNGLDRYRNTKIGFVWQQGSRNLIPYLTALENVSLMSALNAYARAIKPSRPEEVLDFVGLSARRNHRLAELSGGEQQRVAIAVALVNNPRFLLADEPTGEVDSSTAKVIYDLFRRMNREMGLTTLIVSHDPSIAQQVDRVVVIRDGKLASEKIRTSSKNKNEQTELAAESKEFHEYRDLVVLDAAGRLQVPREYLDRFGIRRHVELDVTEQGILIRAADDVPAAPVSSELAANAMVEKSNKKMFERITIPIKTLARLNQMRLLLPKISGFLGRARKKK